jgi:hypothetical protein
MDGRQNVVPWEKIDCFLIAYASLNWVRPFPKASNQGSRKLLWVPAKKAKKNNQAAQAIDQSKGFPFGGGINQAQAGETREHKHVAFRPIIHEQSTKKRIIYRPFTRGQL